MRYLFLAPRLHTNLYFSLEVLKEAGHEVSLLTLYKGKLEDYGTLFTSKELGFSPVFNLLNRLLGEKKAGYLKSNFELRYGFPPVFRLWRGMRKAKPDVVFIKNIDSTFSLLAALFAKVLSIKIVFMLQIDKYRKKTKSGSVHIVGKLFNAKVITPLLGHKEYPNENENLVYIPFVIEAIKNRGAYFKGDKINILSVGEFVGRKNHLLLLKAIKALSSKYPLHLTIIGERADEAYVKEVQSFVLNQGLEDSVSLRYDMSWEDMLKEYERHDLFVLAASDEPAAYSLLEAMSRGLAVVSSSANGTSCYIEEGENGFIFKDKDLSDLITKLEILLEAREMIVSFGRRSLVLANTKYSPPIFLENIHRILGITNSIAGIDKSLVK